MKINMTSSDYLDYIEIIAEKIKLDKDYITELDSATGDGDHWINMNKGFQKLVQSREELETLALDELFKRIGILIMSTVGGSSGVLYGSAYIEGSKVVVEKESMDASDLAKFLRAQLKGIMTRGEAKPGFKTMVDSLHGGVVLFEKALSEGYSDSEALSKLKEGSKKGMEATKGMEAVKGRAYYQANKGIGHLDPGAVTMHYQLESLADFLLNKNS